MTNEEDVSSCDRSPRMAALLAVHIVSQVLNEAYVIANTARDTGEAWGYLATMKNRKPSTLDDSNDEGASFEASKGDCDLNENKIEMGANAVATSTPQKIASRAACSGEGAEPVTHHNDSTIIIGQGDEDLETQYNLANSTSMFINHLFDMSEVERVVICDESDMIQSTSKCADVTVEAVHTIVKPLGTDAPSNLEALPDTGALDDSQLVTESTKSENSDYSFLADAFVADINRDVAFYIDDASGEKDGTIGDEKIEKAPDESSQMSNKNDVALYENAFASLNRDYDIISDDGYPVLQDPKGIVMQEVNLMAANSEDELCCQKLKNQLAKDTAPTISGVSVSKKSTLGRRCRLQGARLLACLRGWWRRKTPGKRKETRHLKEVIGMCPLSPDARRRASSLLDNRLLRSPSPSHPLTWKFNTVNESVVNSDRWKEYTFNAKLEDCGEYF